MSPDIDEDLIEATIRRIQAQAASAPEPSDDDAHEHDAAADVEPPGSATTEVDDITDVAGLHEDPIEATIRRVREQARARAGEDEVAAAPVPETYANVGEVVAAESAAIPELADPPIDEDPIAATIRRVQEQAALRHDESTAFAPAPLPALEDADEEESHPVAAAIEFAERQTSAETAAEESAPSVWRTEAPPLETTVWPGRDERMLGEPATWEIAAQRLERGLQEAQQEVRALTARLEHLLPAMERLLAAGEPSGSPGLSIVAPRKHDAANDWDDSPVVSPMQFGTPPRPAVMRDPSPQTATAAELVPDESALEPPAATAPKLHAIEGKARRLDERVMPRQYRVTVEDKRRGVDLVPLHRAMQGIENVKDMSLLSYSNGVAIVLVETLGPLDPDGLGGEVSRAMAREAKVEVHNEQTMVVKIQEE